MGFVILFCTDANACRTNARLATYVDTHAIYTNIN